MTDRKPSGISADEKTTLLGFLNYLRDAITAKATGVPEPQVRTPGVPSDTSLLGLIKAPDVRRVLPLPGRRSPQLGRNVQADQ